LAQDADPPLPIIVEQPLSPAEAAAREAPPVVEELDSEPTVDLPMEPLDIDLEALQWQLPEPERFRAVALEKVAEADALLEQKPRDIRDLRDMRGFYSRLSEHLQAVSRRRKLRVPLPLVLHLAMAHSYVIRVEGYNPAIAQTEIVEATGAFDMVFFGNVTKTIDDQPVANQLQTAKSDFLTISGGLRQLLPTGMIASTSLELNRTQNDFQFQLLNPAYDSAFTVEFRQPLLRGFGIDYNRSQIRLAKNNRRQSDQAFIREVQDTLLQVETAYWRLFQARRIATVQARLLATFEQIYERLEQRGKFDVIPIQIAETRAQLENARADYIRILNEIRDAEDSLIALVNDPSIDLADDIEIIPITMPTLDPLIMDRLGEAQLALDNRPEIAEARIAVNSARILVGNAKNQAMPQADLLFRYKVQGLGGSAHRAFSEVSKNDYHEYVVGVEFELPIGNRARRAAERRARLQHGQAIARLKLAFEQVIFDVNVRFREVLTQHNLIGPRFESTVAKEEQVESIRARAETQNYIQLSNELGAIQQLAALRNELLNAIMEYNIAIIELERAKGTLLDYYNVVVPTPENGSGH
jgi:outer membrane protein TolC